MKKKLKDILLQIIEKNPGKKISIKLVSEKLEVNAEDIIKILGEIEKTTNMTIIYC